MSSTGALITRIHFIPSVQQRIPKSSIHLAVTTTNMKSIIASASLLALVASVAAAPSSNTLRYGKRQIGGPGVGPVCTSSTQPSQQDVLSALETWNSDVENVNTFLNGVAADTDPLSLEGLARGALDNAMDEPLELGILACIPGLTDDAENAITSAADGFMNNVLVPLMDIVVNGANTPQVDADVLQINTFRCCTLLPDLDVLWLAAAEDEGIVGQVNLNVPRPDACATISC